MVEIVESRGAKFEELSTMNFMSEDPQSTHNNCVRLNSHLKAQEEILDFIEQMKVLAKAPEENNDQA